MQRYFIYLAYDGTRYHGWQIQPNGDSVQQQLMNALQTLLRREVIEVTGAGRTDAGVHAKLMVAHFDYDDAIDCMKLTDKLNRLLPPDISVFKVIPVDTEMHARFSAKSRRYEYYVTIDHPMRKDHYISFLAAVSDSRVQFAKLYPEGNAEARFKIDGVRKFYAYCNRHGLFQLKK